MDPQNPLDDELRSLEAAAREFDAGHEAEAAARIADGLRRVFHQTASSTPLLSRLKATYARVASSVPKAPHPQGAFLPLVNVTVTYQLQESLVVSTATGPADLGEAPRFSPRLGKAAAFRQVQAPDWWKTEPVFIIDHSRVTRRDLALWAVVVRDGAVPDAEKLPQVYERVRQGDPVTVPIPMANGAVLPAPFRDAHRAALRQLAYEVVNSPELLKTAGRGLAPSS